MRLTTAMVPVPIKYDSAARGRKRIFTCFLCGLNRTAEPCMVGFLTFSTVLIWAEDFWCSTKLWIRWCTATFLAHDLFYLSYVSRQSQKYIAEHVFFHNCTVGVHALFCVSLLDKRATEYKSTNNLVCEKIYGHLIISSVDSIVIVFGWSVEEPTISEKHV